MSDRVRVRILSAGNIKRPNVKNSVETLNSNFIENLSSLNTTHTASPNQSVSALWIRAFKDGFVSLLPNPLRKSSQTYVFFVLLLLCLLVLKKKDAFEDTLPI